jgi:hypothetical protein
VAELALPIRKNAYREGGTIKTRAGSVTSGAVSGASNPSANTLLSPDRAVPAACGLGGIETNALCLVPDTSAM